MFPIEYLSHYNETYFVVVVVVKMITVNAPMYLAILYFWQPIALLSIAFLDLRLNGEAIGSYRIPHSSASSKHHRFNINLPSVTIWYRKMVDLL